MTDGTFAYRYSSERSSFVRRSSHTVPAISAMPSRSDAGENSTPMVRPLSALAADTARKQWAGRNASLSSTAASGDQYVRAPAASVVTYPTRATESGDKLTNGSRLGSSPAE